MADSYGTDGRYNAIGMPTIIRRPDEAGLSENEFFATLSAGLLFAKKFHLDAAWLVNSRLADLIADRHSGIYRLILKDHVGILCRLPLEQMKDELAENRVAFDLLTRKAKSGHGRVWDWPTGKPRVIRKSISDDSPWEIPVRTSSEPTLIASNNEQEIGTILAKHFVSVESNEDDITPPVRFWSLLGAVSFHGVSVKRSNTSPMEERLCGVSLTNLESALRGSSMSNVLGGLREESIFRNDLCRKICKSLTSGKGTFENEALALLRDATPRIAELLGIEPDVDLCNSEIYVSVRDAVTFLLSWDQL